MTGQNEPNQPVVNLLILKTAGHYLSFRTRDVREIVHMAELIVTPGLPSFIEGFLNFEGQAAAVLSLSRLFFGSAPGKHLYTPLVILETSPFLTAVLADNVTEIAAVPQNRLMPVKEEDIFNRSITAVFTSKLPAGNQTGAQTGIQKTDQSVYLVSPNRLLMEEEKARVKEFQDTARRRLEQPAAGGTVEENQ